MSNDLSLVPAPVTYNQTIIQRAFTVLQQTFSNYSQVKAAATNATYLLTTNTTPVSSNGSSGTILMSYPLPANQIARVGSTIQIQAFGVFAANSNAKEVQLFFGSTLVADSTSQVANGGNWSFDCTLMTVGINAEQAITNFNSDNSAFTDSTNYVMPSEILSAILAIEVLGFGGMTGDVTQNGMLVKLFPANPITT